MEHPRTTDPNQPKCTIYHGCSVSPDPAYPSRWRDAAELWAKGPGDEAALLIVDRSMLERRDRLRKLPRRVVLVAADEASQEALRRRAPISIAGLEDPAARNRVIHAACSLACARRTGVALRKRLARHKREARELTRVGMGLMLEPDRADLLRQIVRQGKRLTESDAGALLLIETGEHDIPRLRPVLWDFDFLPELRVPPTTYPIDHTNVPGYAAHTGETIVVDDVYNLPAGTPFRHDTTLDETYGYHTKSGLIVPMIDHRGRKVGVLALGNRKSDPNARITSKESADRYVLAYTGREVELARSLASQAAVSIEIHQLYERIEDTLESFIRAGVTAIDQRDPATAGHSLRVASLATALAAAVDRIDRGKYRDVHFSRAQLRELRFAALVHDVGKVAVREAVLMKSKKLPPVLWERVDARFALIHRTIELEYCKRRVDLRCSPATDRVTEARLDAELAAQLEQLERMRRMVTAANEPDSNSGHPQAELGDIASRTFERVDGSLAPYLTRDELHFLQIPSGTLDDDERVEVESHVDQGRRFLADIPLTDDLKNLVTYACDHHERLDGSGYPKRLSGDEIPLQAQLITLADMFDALTEGDRPYKPAISVDEALGVLRSEARAGRLDADLVEIMIESRSYETPDVSEGDRLLSSHVRAGSR
jgi:HD-GYP domain-containing protein (c-di-GMP phosphodiesterase class II)